MTLHWFATKAAGARRLAAAMIGLLALCAVPRDAAALVIKFDVRNASFEVAGKRVTRVGGSKIVDRGIAVGLHFGTQSGVPNETLAVSLPVGAETWDLRGEFVSIRAARQNSVIDPSGLANHLRDLAEAGFGEAGPPAATAVEIVRADVRTRGRRNVLSGRVRDRLALRVKIVANVRDANDPTAAAVRVKVNFKGTYRHTTITGQDPDPGPGPGPGPSLCPLHDLLAPSGIRRDPTQLEPTPQETALLQQMDAQRRAAIFQSPVVTSYRTAMSELLVRARIAPVNVSVVADMRLSAAPVNQYAGGMAVHESFILDGKLLDILAEYARYRILVDDGVEFRNDGAALDRIVTQHNAFLGAAPNGVTYTASMLSPSQTTRATERFLRSAAPVFYHEFGHIFTWVALDGLRSQAGLLPEYALHPSLHENDADKVAGALVRKSGGTTADIEFLLDVMTFYSLNRNGAVTTYAQVRSPQIQNLKPNPQYASLAERKAIAIAAYHCE